MKSFATKAIIIALFAIGSILRLSAAGNGWTLTACEADTARYSPPSIGNGQIGVVMDRTGLGASRMFTATAVSRGRDTKISSIIPSISPIRLSVTADGLSAPVSDWRQTLDMRYGGVTTDYRIPGAEISCTFYALRSMPFVTVASLSVTALRDVTVTVSDRPEIPSSLADAKITMRRLSVGRQLRQLVRAEATYNGGTDAIVSSIAMIGSDWTQLSPDSLTVSMHQGEQAQLTVVASTVCTADFADPWNESERQVLYAVTTGLESLMARHNRAWDDLWRGDIEIEGNDRLQSVARTALYNLYCASSPGSGRSIAPMGLTSRHYYGHIFWDADTWMLPVMAVLQPQIAKDMADYRIATLPQARRRAAAYGYDGAMFAWESDDLGEESTPTFALTGPLEHHVTADVAHGAWLYFCASADTLWLREKAWPLLRDCADFWVSRVEKGPDGKYSIKGVVGADEYAIGVDDNAFTNAAAKRALEYAVKAAGVVGVAPDARWAEVAAGIRFHRLPATDIVAEYDGYDGEQIKQADVALLAYPLGLLKKSGEIERNLDYYDAKTDSIGGPAMSHSAMAVNYARMGRGDRAGRLIARAYEPNLRGPFLNLSESPGNDHIYFATGAGGLLQSLLFGFAGLEIDTESGGVKQLDSSLPSDVSRVIVKTPSGQTYERRTRR